MTMPIDPSSSTVLSALRNLPQMAHGMVREIRVRWALEEIDRPYRTEIFEGMTPRPDDYREWQPFGQVPAFDDGQIQLFESGAILLYLGEQDERLLPREPQARWQATCWLIEALNSIEPALMQVLSLDIFQAGKPWAKDARPSAVEFAKMRLSSLANSLGDKPWLTSEFTVADIMMVTVLRNLRHTDIISSEYPNLAEYIARGEARPAFIRAMADQISDLGPPITLGQAA
jgi:glutathione S-transferase